ncbi:GNAT family N-acetyltransferase [Amycolatopsis sp. NPDC059027]|uniref:GNAT family N-acetyltransferase n=1 Tax=Amycolatopsis sp. NPDC059027 TaxID=3346709 RepID=UPI00366FB811
MNKGALTLEGRITRLRELRTTDVDDVVAIIGDDRVTRFLSFDSRDRNYAESMISGVAERAAAEPRAEYYMAVTSLESDALIGFVRIATSGVRAAKLGYAIAAEFWGRGYATDAVRTMVDFAFARLELHRITAAIGPDNAASHVVVRKLGFVKEGVLRDHVFTNGAWRDSVLYSILASEWSADG